MNAIAANANVHGLGREAAILTQIHCKGVQVFCIRQASWPLQCGARGRSWFHQSFAPKKVPLCQFRRYSSSFLVLVLCVVLVAHAKTLLLDESDNNSHLCLYVGDTLSIKLAANPTTGYSWAKPEAFLHLDLIISRSERGSSDRVGAPGFQVFAFKATEPGESDLDLNYLRP